MAIIPPLPTGGGDTFELATSIDVMPTNRLAQETSPYLLQHAHNPVDWYPWGPEALGRARTENKPIFLSIGYAACHWCHVMERESFENEDTARRMNADFIAIKVDREERPDLDSIYMDAVQQMTGQGGWPMSVFLTPEGKPFYGGTYFPDRARHGLPAFNDVLEGVADAWRDRRDEIERAGSTLAAAIDSHVSAAPVGADVGTDAGGQGWMLDAALVALEREFDARNGGWGGAPKFPQPMTIEFLLRLHVRSATTGRWRWRARRSTRWPPAASTTTSVADSPVTRRIRFGSFRTSRRCSTTTRSSPAFTRMPGSSHGVERYREVVEETLEFVAARTAHGGRRICGEPRRRHGR